MVSARDNWLLCNSTGSRQWSCAKGKVDPTSLRSSLDSSGRHPFRYVKSLIFPRVKIYSSFNLLGLLFHPHYHLLKSFQFFCCLQQLISELKTVLQIRSDKCRDQFHHLPYQDIKAYLTSVKDPDWTTSDKWVFNGVLKWEKTDLVRTLQQNHIAEYIIQPGPRLLSF